MTSIRSETVTGEATILVAGDTMKIEVTVPAGPTDVGTLLPIFQQVTSALVERAVERDGGRPVSCRAGCGACCRQPVPVSPSEVRAIADLVAALPPPQRAAIRQRFAAARTTLAAAGVLIDLDVLRTMTIADQIAWGKAYITTGVACPFLVAEACSIHPERPIICREYLVTNPAENCRVPAPETIRRVPLQGSLAAALAVLDRDLGERGPMLLVDSLVWSAANPPAPPSRTGPALIEAAFKRLADDSAQRVHEAAEG